MRVCSFGRSGGRCYPRRNGCDARLGHDGSAIRNHAGKRPVAHGCPPDGRVIRTARRARSSAGYDLTRLFVGSEGTLGVFTEVTVRLQGIPAAISAAMCSFPSVKAAVNAVMQTIQAGVPVARMELADAIRMDAIIRYSKLDLPVAPVLWMEFHGTENGVAEQAKMVQRIAGDHGSTHFAWATTRKIAANSGRRATMLIMQARRRARVWRPG